MELAQLAAEISSKEQLATFVSKLHKDFVANPNEWENQDLERYLEAMSSWLVDMDGYNQNRNSETPIEPTWGTFAEVLLAAKYYE
jgi:hypothetical protein